MTKKQNISEQNSPMNLVIRHPSSVIPTLVIASHNAGKVSEIGDLIAPLGIQAISATDASVTEPEETGDSFEENATLKALHAAESSNLPSLADDSGLVVPAIGGAPGIYSARWAGPTKDFTIAFKRIQTELGDQPTDAYFICVLALCLPSQTETGQWETHLFKGRIDGTLTFPPRGDKGFGYDPIFIPTGYDTTFAEFDPLLKNRISHRARAFEKFLYFLNRHTW